MMDVQPTSDTPNWRIAIIGSGPSAFYAAQALFKQDSWPLRVDMFERLPTPYGLVRGGVAPDHQKIKSVIKIYERIASNERFRFFGNVEFGRDVSREDLLEHYDAVLYAVGSSSDRQLGVPGEDVSGVHSATEFVGWYNGHPDYRHWQFDLSSKSVAIIGMGNVAIDVARILAHRMQEIEVTDIADHALQELAGSQIEDIYLIARRGPVQAAFTPVEARELLEMPEADALANPEELQLDEGSQQELDAAGRETRQNLEILNKMAERGNTGKPKRLRFVFLTSPAEVLSEGGKVTGLKLERNVLKQRNGKLSAAGSGETFTLDCGLVFRSIGYKGLPQPGLPYDAKSGTVPNQQGQVFNPETGAACLREYVAGWVKRGPSGVIGTNKPDAVESVRTMLQTFLDEKWQPKEATGVAEIEALLESRQVDTVSFSDWKRLDEHEVRAGQESGKPRRKVSDPEEMLRIIRSG